MSANAHGFTHGPQQKLDGVRKRPAATKIASDGEKVAVILIGKWLVVPGLPYRKEADRIPLLPADIPKNR